MRFLMRSIRKSLAILLVVTVNVAEPWRRPASATVVHHNTFIFDGIATSASTDELISYLESLNLYVLASKDINLINTPARAVLYTGENYSGQSVSYNSNQQFYPLCQTLSNDLQGRIKSIKTYNSCVRLYSENYCRGPHRLYTEYSYEHLKLGNFQVKSIGSCNQLYFRNN
ncbi:unnamed protein product [Allacma fusca]|uniref:Uncharacterized protein n=1 Tax=Allacma fusca TaxID=39272 RepID=A0A8J2P4F5_9HEXA|nr:unnamed protein product [Allacma fusca]